MRVVLGWISSRARKIAVAGLVAAILLLPACYGMTGELSLPDAGEASEPADEIELDAGGKADAADQAGAAGRAGAAGEAGGAAGAGGSGPMDGGLDDGGPGNAPFRRDSGQ